MKTAYRILAYLVAIGVVMQAAFIAFGVFGLAHDLERGAVVDTNYNGNAGWAMHALNGEIVIPSLAMILLIISFFARIRRGIRWAATVFGLVIVQVMLAYAAFGAAIVGLLHGMNALALFLTALLAGRRVGKAAIPESVAADESARVTDAHAQAGSREHPAAEPVSEAA